MSFPVESVAIFWDYENCTIPGNFSGYEVVNAIRRIAQEFGSVTLFKAYLGVSEQVQSPRSLNLRSELQASGVSLTDCPHNGRKDVADKMMLVDMLAHAIDHPTPTTFLLISGDRDFSYALSILRLRRYRVVLITSPNAHASLTAQASLRLNWATNVLENSRASQKDDPAASNRVNFSLATEYNKGTNITVVCNPTPRPKAKGQSASDPDSTLVMAEGASARRRSRFDQTQNGPATAPPQQINSEAPISFFGTPFRLPFKSIGPPLRPDTTQDLTNDAQFADRKGKGRVPSVQLPSDLAESQAGSSHDPYHEDYQSDASSQPPSSEEAGPRYDNYALWDSPEGDDDPSTPPPTTTSPRAKHVTRPSESNSFKSSLGSPSRKKRQDGTYISIPSRFKPLVKQLQLYRSKGIYIPQRSILCIDLGKKYQRIYQNAEVEDFAEYVSLAEQEGFVTLGGGDGLNPWIMLRQEWVNVTF